VSTLAVINDLVHQPACLDRRVLEFGEPPPGN
jgi:hypothetical protein